MSGMGTCLLKAAVLRYSGWTFLSAGESTIMYRYTGLCFSEEQQWSTLLHILILAASSLSLVKDLTKHCETNNHSKGIEIGSG